MFIWYIVGKNIFAHVGFKNEEIGGFKKLIVSQERGLSGINAVCVVFFLKRAIKSFHVSQINITSFVVQSIAFFGQIFSAFIESFFDPYA
jgi:hypothetical protein